MLCAQQQCVLHQKSCVLHQKLNVDKIYCAGVLENKHNHKDTHTMNELHNKQHTHKTTPTRRPLEAGDSVLDFYAYDPATMWLTGVHTVAPLAACHEM